MLSATLVAALAGCTLAEVQSNLKSIFDPSKGQAALKKGLQQYEDGEYAESAKSLQSALDLGLDKRQQVSAHKHLAFINCASNREQRCRDEFRRALALEPTMELEPAEAGHPVWGPIFRSLKTGK